MLGRLFKHDIGGALNVSEMALNRNEDVDTLGVTDLEFDGRELENMSDIREGDMDDLEDSSELEIFEEFIGVANAASERLESNYNLRSVSEEIQYLKDFDEERISELGSDRRGPRGYVEKISALADNISDYVDRTRGNFGDETTSIQEVFESFENFGDVVYNGTENSEVSGDEGLCVVANTIAKNALDHGSTEGEELDLYAEVKEEEDLYRIDIWDDGSGLSEGFDEEEIFRRDTGDNSGLGLYLAREITELFDGSLEYSPENAARQDGFGLEWVLRKPEYVEEDLEEVEEEENYISSQ